MDIKSIAICVIISLLPSTAIGESLFQRSDNYNKNNIPYNTEAVNGDLLQCITSFVVKYRIIDNLANKVLRGWADKEYERRNPKQFAEGGEIAKLQYGGWSEGNARYQEYITKKAKDKEQSVKSEALTSGKSEQQVKDYAIVGTIGLTVLFFIMSTTVFCVIYIKERRYNPYINE